MKIGGEWVDGLWGEIEDASALFAVNDFASALDLDDGLGGDLHVATCTVFVFEGDDGFALIFEEVVVGIEEIFVDGLDEGVADFLDLGELLGDDVYFGGDVLELAFDLGFDLFGLVFGGEEGEFGDFGKFHGFEFTVFDIADVVLVAGDLVIESLEFFVFLRLKLLGLKLIDGVAFGLGFEFEFFSSDLDVFGVEFGGLEGGGGLEAFLFGFGAFQWGAGEFLIEDPNLAVAFLDDEELFDFRAHDFEVLEGREKGSRVSGGLGIFGVPPFGEASGWDFGDSETRWMVVGGIVEEGEARSD